MWSKAISWIDDCRIPFVDEKDIPNDMDKTHLEGRNFHTQIYNGFLYQQNTQGRFPANILVSDDMLNDGIISKSMKGGKGKALPNSDGKNDGKRMRPETIKERGGFDDKGTNSRYYDIDKWFDKIVND